MKITAICQEDGYYDVFIYTVNVADPDNYEEVCSTIQAERERDIGDEAGEMSVLFTFDGDLKPRSDFRE